MLPPLPLPLDLLLWLLPELLPPRLEEPSEVEMAAARDLLMPFLRRPSYCLSFLTLDPWSIAMALNYPGRAPPIQPADGRPRRAASASRRRVWGCWGCGWRPRRGACRAAAGRPGGPRLRCRSPSRP